MAASVKSVKVTKLLSKDGCKKTDQREEIGVTEKITLAAQECDASPIRQCQWLVPRVSGHERSDQMIKIEIVKQGRAYWNPSSTTESPTSTFG